MKRKEELTKDWIVGFVEGEGSFGLSPNKFSKTGYKPFFQLHQAEKEILERVADILPVRHGGIHKQSNGCYAFETSALDDIRALVPYFDGEFKTKHRKEQFRTWKKEVKKFCARKNRKNIRWTEEEIEYLKENWKDSSDEELAENLNRTVRGIEDRRRRLGLGRTQGVAPQDEWTEEEIAYLDKHYGSKKVEEIAEDLGRSTHAVTGKAYDMGITGRY